MKSKYVITSDWHIGSEVCQRDKIIKMLKSINTENLILNGGIIDIDHLKRLKKKDWEILSILRKLSKDVNIIYIRGNHDPKISETISDLLGFTFKNELDVEVNGIKFHITHGDVFDYFITNMWLLTEIATGVYYFIQRFSSKNQVLARSLKKKSKSFIKCCENLKERAVKFAIKHKYDYVIAGHTHQYFISYDCKYVNAGCFTEVDCSYIEINKLGGMLIKFIEE